MAPVAIVLGTPPQSPRPTQSATARCFTFTPKPKPKVPRAWERKPYTPFVPRTETQKIWKRYEFRGTNISGTVQSQAMETRALKKLRLEGQETTAFITSWDEELHETIHKQSADPDKGAIIRPALIDPASTVSDIGRLVLACEIDDSMPNDRQNVKEQDTADNIADTKETRLFFVEETSASHQDLDELISEGRLMPKSPSDVQTTARHPDLERPRVPAQQDIDKHLVERGSAVSPQTQSTTTDAETSSLINDRDAKEEGVIMTSPIKDDGGTSKEQVSLKESLGRAKALQLCTIVEEAAKGDTASGQHQQVINVQPPHPQTQTTHEILAFDKPTDPLEVRTRNEFVPQRRDAKAGDDHIISQEQRYDYNITPNDEASPQRHPEGFKSLSDPELIQDKEPERHEMVATGGVKKQNIVLESPLRRDLPTQAQDHRLIIHTAVQDEDTDFLHAFLTRAKANKAARETSPQKVERVPPSPMTRSRAALVPLSTNSPSPNKTKPKELDTTYESEVLEINRAESSCRRSGRTRLPRPHKAPAVAPNTIPVRRSKGTEFVFLQNNDTAQVALTTRTNTQRNKGEAVMPKIKLQALSQAQKSPSKSPKLRKGKAVSWKDEPTYFDNQTDDAEEARERRKADDKPRARKTRRRGDTNGTPAPKKIMVEDPVPRKRGKVKS